MCWRSLVLSDGTLHKDDKQLIHAQDVADLTDLTGAALPNKSPVFPKNITWNDRSSTGKFTTRNRQEKGEESVVDLPESQSHVIPSDYEKLASGRRSNQSEPNKGVDPVPTLRA